MQRALSERLAETAAAAPHQASHTAVARERLEVRSTPLRFQLVRSHKLPLRTSSVSASDNCAIRSSEQAFSDVFDEVIRRGAPFASLLMAVKREFDSVRAALDARFPQSPSHSASPCDSSDSHAPFRCALWISGAGPADG